MEGKKQLLATLVGCNYAGTPHELRGCINDVLAMFDTLVARFGFAPGDITVLTDDDRSAAAVLPTGANIKRPGTFSYSTAAPTAGLRSCAGAGVRAQVSIQRGRDRSSKLFQDYSLSPRQQPGKSNSGIVDWVRGPGRAAAAVVIEATDGGGRRGHLLC